MQPTVICTAIGIANYTSGDATCLSVAENRYYAVTKQSDASWWCARLIDDEGVITGQIGLIPSEHVSVLGPGLILPKSRKKKGSATSHSLGGSASPDLSKKDKKKRRGRHSGEMRSPPSSAGPAVALTAEAFARALGDKDAELERMRSQLEAAEARLAQALARTDDQQRVIDSLKVCQRCGAPVAPISTTTGSADDEATADESGAQDVGAASGGVETLVKEGYERDAVLKVQRMVRSYVLRLRFRQVAMNFKNHKASLVMRLRNEALREIYTSEKKYVDSLLLCMTEIYAPLVRLTNAKNSRLGVTRGQVAEIFASLDIIVELNRGLLVDLEQRLAQWPSVQKFGDLFVRMAPILRLYSGYVRNFETSQKALAQCREMPSFQTALSECEESTKGLQLESFLIMPVQRLPRYQMLLQGLLKYTDEHHVDFDDLTKAQAAMVSICLEINTHKRLDENCKAVRSLTDEVEGLLDHLGSSAYFIHRGHLHSIKGSSIDAYHFLLFDDLLVRAVQARKRMSTAPAWMVHEATPLAGIESVVDIPDMEGIRNCVELSLLTIKSDGELKTLKLGLCSPSSADKAVWLQKANAYTALVAGDEGGVFRSALVDATGAMKEELFVAAASGSLAHGTPESTPERRRNAANRTASSGALVSSPGRSQSSLSLRLSSKMSRK